MRTRTTTRTETQTIRLESMTAAAACLTVCPDCKVVEITPIGPNRCEFILSGKAVEETAANFLLGRVEGNLQCFMRHFDDLRTAIRKLKAVK